MKNIQITEESHEKLKAISAKRKTNRHPVRSMVDILEGLISKEYKKEIGK